MLGQFYRGCAVSSVHNPAWTKVLTAPYLAFAIRYMQPHDHLFVPWPRRHDALAALARLQAKQTTC